MAKSVVNSNQPSITEWFAAIGEVEESEKFRLEDNTKIDRLEVLFQTIGLPYERPEPWPARALVERTPEFEKLLKDRGDELCAIRLVPKDPSLPKLRNRGLSIRECYESWFLKQTIDPDQYTALICPHSDSLLWSAIFVINNDAVFGEVIRGAHSQLTQGETVEEPMQFRFDFRDWEFSNTDKEAQDITQRMINALEVTGEQAKKISAALESNFSHGYIRGYFETTVWPDNKLFFIDYNRILETLIPTMQTLTKTNSSQTLQGTVAFPGRAHGVAIVIEDAALDTIDFPAGSILVCDNTDVRYLPYMQKAAAIVTNRGGILSHAAIIARELKKPCIIGTKNATATLKTGELVGVDANQGIVKRL